MKRTGPTNPILREAIVALERLARKENAPIWKRVAEELARPTRKRREVNVGEIEKYAREGEVILVPGKVLGRGKIKKKVTVVAWSFSASAAQKIRAAGGEVLGILEYASKNPRGSGVRIMG